MGKPKLIDCSNAREVADCRAIDALGSRAGLASSMRNQVIVHDAHALLIQNQTYNCTLHGLNKTNRS